MRLFFFAGLNLEQTEIELKKRWAVPYKWGRKQANIWDDKTNFIYQISYFEHLNDKIYSELGTHAQFEELRNYALNRWYNFVSAQAVESIFTSHSLVRKVKNVKDREKDFFINGIPFDHKTTVFPAGFEKDLESVEINPKALVKWLYLNQSSEQRYHLKNRFFLVLHKKDEEHWRLKAELTWIKETINHYLDHFDEQKLIELTYSKGVVKADLILGSR